MKFKNRLSAGRKLAKVLSKNKYIEKCKKNVIVLSLIRGGAPVGHEIAKYLDCKHLPLVVKKISAPSHEELAIGAVCGTQVFLNLKLIDHLSLTKKDIDSAIKRAKQKQNEYNKQYNIKKIHLKGKVVIIVDDGIATGASIIAAAICTRKRGAKKIILAVPVAPAEFDPYDGSLFKAAKKTFDDVVILYKADNFHAVGQFYKNFKQLTDKEVIRYFKE